MPVLKPKATAKTKTFSVRLPTDLYTQIEQVKADAEAAGLVFDAVEVCEKALAVAVRTARQELDAART